VLLKSSFYCRVPGCTAFSKKNRWLKRHGERTPTCKLSS
jgi:hypothetical protein